SRTICKSLCGEECQIRRKERYGLAIGQEQLNVRSSLLGVQIISNIEVTDATDVIPRQAGMVHSVVIDVRESNLRGGHGGVSEHIVRRIDDQLFGLGAVTTNVGRARLDNIVSEEDAIDIAAWLQGERIEISLDDLVNEVGTRERGHVAAKKRPSEALRVGET